MALSLSHGDIRDVEALLREAHQKLWAARGKVEKVLGAAISDPKPPRNLKDDHEVYNDIWDAIRDVRRALSKLP
jgi:hypothetical protein